MAFAQSPILALVTLCLGEVRFPCDAEAVMWLGGVHQDDVLDVAS